MKLKGWTTSQCCRYRTSCSSTVRTVLVRQSAKADGVKQTWRDKQQTKPTKASRAIKKAFNFVSNSSKLDASRVCRWLRYALPRFWNPKHKTVKHDTSVIRFTIFACQTADICIMTDFSVSTIYCVKFSSFLSHSLLFADDKPSTDNVKERNWYKVMGEM